MSKQLTLDKPNAKLAGVCSGLARWSGWDANLIRLIFVLATIFGFGSAVIVYIVIALVAG